ncbi:MAG: hypothetical protein AAFQ65_12145 [Myxococcota bacterium]
MKIASLVLVIVAAGMTVFAQIQTNSVVTIPYRGLLEIDGELADGEVAVRFNVHVDDPSSPPSYCENQIVEVLRGRFAADIGTGFPISECNLGLEQLLGTQRALYLTMSVEAGNGPIALQGSQRISAAPYAAGALANRGDIPVGTVIEWFMPGEDLEPPAGFVVADGRIVDDPESPFNDQTLPDLSGLFLRGVADASQMGIGGDDVHQHSLSRPSHQHGVSLPGHSHVLSYSHTHSTSSEGTHSHAVNGRTENARDGGNDNSYSSVSRTSTSGAGAHSHSVQSRSVSFMSDVGGAIESGSETNGGGQQTVTSEPISNVPAIYLIRIK